MSEGLRVNVIPMLDENEFEKLIRNANEKLSNTTFSMVGGNVISNPTYTPSSSTTFNTPTGTDTPKVDATGSTVAVDNKTAESIGESTAKEMDKADEKTDSQKKILDNISKMLTSFIGAYDNDKDSGGSWRGRLLSEVKDQIPDKIGKALGVIGIVADVVSKIFDSVFRSSKVLQEVWGLFDNAFTMILMPIGNIFAIQMMPMIRKMYETIGEWMSSAMEIYDMEGWVGLLNSAMDVAFELMWEALVGFGGIIGEIFWELLVDWVTNTTEWRGLMKGVEILSTLWDWVSNGLNDILVNTIVTLATIPTKIREFFTEDIPDFFTGLVNGFSNMLSSLPIFIGIKSVIDSIFGLFSGDWLTVVRDTLLTIGKVITSIADGIGAGVTGVWDWFTGLFPFASGGIVSQPTPAIFGEAGTEAVMPLEYLDTLLLNNEVNAIEMATPIIASTVSEAITTNGMNTSLSTAYSSRSATNVYNTINVYSDDPNRVGNEIKRLLDKSVGKVLSLY